MKRLNMFKKENLLLIACSFILISCGNSCEDQDVVDGKHRICSKLEIKVDERGNLIQTYGCATKSGEAFVDYYVRGSQLCYKSTFNY
jgi:hypothetical protein